MKVLRLDVGQADNAVAVLCDAFHEYPVMRFVLGDSSQNYDRRLATLISLFVAARMLREEPLLGVRNQTGALTAVAVMTLPGERPSPEALSRKRAAVWQELGSAARERYDRFSSSGAEYALTTPHHHLNMIGVRRADAGRGFGRALLEAVHHLSAQNPGSSGVTLTTEDSRNLPLYEKFGYRLLGHSRVSQGLESWSLYRPSQS
jgi:ribosomal protein S18 acetylase RimI-like enzyme